MATSGSYDFSCNRNEVIEEAYRVARILGDDQTLGSGDLTRGAFALNLIVKQWQGRTDFAAGLKTYARKRLTLFFAKGQQRYLIGPASTDARCTEVYGRTTLSANEAIGQTTISITSNTDATTFPGSTVTMTNGDFVAIEQDDGTLHWSTISGTPASTMTIALATTVAASSGNFVYWFTSRAQRFDVIEHALLREFDTVTAGKYSDSPLYVYRDVREYEGLADKTGDGDPTAVLIEPLRIATAATFNMQPDNVRKVVNLTVMYTSEDYDAATDDIAYPQVWFRPLVYQLGVDLCVRNGRPVSPDLLALRNESLQMAQQENPIASAMYFQPGRD